MSDFYQHFVHISGGEAFSHQPSNDTRQWCRPACNTALYGAGRNSLASWM